MYVFRSERRLISGESLVCGLRDALSCATAATVNRGAVLNALLRAGELECALADFDQSNPQLPVASTLSDTLAGSLLQGSPVGSGLPEMLARLRIPRSLVVTKPEGFAYYGLHPLAYARLVNGLPDEFGHAAVIGLRSIGTTLSAVVTAALCVRGKLAERTTTRPEGHPFDRRCRFTEEQLLWIRSRLDSRSQFFVVDEGPGLSGSSLLSVAEALIAAGVPRAGITVLCSHTPDPERLRAPDAARRWKSFRSVGLGFGESAPHEAADWIGAGYWRNFFLPSPGSSPARPACWTQVERAKYLARDRPLIYKFEGLGPYGEQVLARSRLLAGLRVSPDVVPSPHVEGYACYVRVLGRSLHPVEASGTPVAQRVLQSLARYCAIRMKEFACDVPPLIDGEVSLAEMCRQNALKEFAIELPVTERFLPCERLVIADAHMMPHEWIHTPTDELVKIDGASHGDDHFFPGPCDIAWDLAGVIVEWKLPPASADFLLREYRRLSGDDPTRRLSDYLLAYLLFRMGYCKMASEAMQGTDDEAPLRAAYQSYREQVVRQLQAFNSNLPKPQISPVALSCS